MLTDEQLQAMTPEQRIALAHRLAAFDRERRLPTMNRHARLLRRWFMTIVVTSCLALIGWIVLLALTLPRHYVTGHWDAAWVGFDIALLAGLVSTAWAAWLRRQAVILAAFTTATLLICDAWFDVLTASGHDLPLSVASALCVELPLAALLAYVARRLLLLTVHTARALVGVDPDIPLHRVPLLGVARRPPQR